MEINILRKWICNVVIALICYSSVYAVDGRKVCIAVDISGSMKGFFVGQGIQEYVDYLRNQLERNHDCAVLSFIEKELIDYRPMPDRYGQSTYIDEAFNNLLKMEPSISIIITDNFQDIKLESAATLKFYDLLAAETVYKLHIVPKLLSFNGRIYNDTYNNTNVKEYSGKRGLLTYLILHDTLASDQYNEVTSIFRNEEILLIKPITKNEINIVGVPDSELNLVPAAIDAMKEKCPEVKVPKKDRPNAKIVENGILVPLNPKIPCHFPWEKRSRLLFYFLFVSQMNHVNIGTAGDICDDHVKLSVGKLSIRNDAPGLSLKNTIRGKIIPPSLVGMLKSNQRGNYCYRADIMFGPCRADWNIQNFWKYARWDWHCMGFKPFAMKIAFDISIEVPGKYFVLTEEYREKYFTSSQEDFERIFSPTDIVQYINVRPMLIELKVVSR